MNLARHHAPGAVADAVAVRGQADLIALVEIHEAVGDLAQRQRIGGEEVLLDADAQHQRAAAARADQGAGLGFGDDGECVGAFQPGQGGGQRGGQILAPAHQIMHQVGDHLGVGLGMELIAGGFQLGAQVAVVFDDAVVHHRDGPGAVRMRVGLAGLAVGGPARVGDAELAGKGRALHVFGQQCDLAGVAAALQAVAAQNRHARGVVAAIFEALQAFQKNRCHIALGRRRDDAAHDQ